MRRLARRAQAAAWPRLGFRDPASGEACRRRRRTVVRVIGHKNRLCATEIRLALDAAEERPDGQIYVVPVALDDIVALPERLGRWQMIRMSHPEWFDRLVLSLQHCASRLGKSAPADATYLRKLTAGVLEQQFIDVLGQPSQWLARHGDTSGRRLVWRRRCASISASVDNTGQIEEYVVQAEAPGFTAPVPLLPGLSGDLVLGQSTFADVALKPIRSDALSPPNGRWSYFEEYYEGPNTGYKHVGLGCSYWSAHGLAIGAQALDVRRLVDAAASRRAVSEEIAALRNGLIVSAFAISVREIRERAVVQSEEWT